MAKERLFKYPPMERQDLNQSQLGSFKFTPVDPVQNVQSLTQSARHFLDQQLSQRQRLTEPSSTSTGHISTLSAEWIPPQPKVTMANTAFFNEHIKPDLGDSRLRLGPAALRSAVDGASPTKKVSSVRNQHEAVYPDHFSRQNIPNIASPHLSHVQSADLDPTAPPYLNQDSVDTSSLCETLCMALANEQRAHNSTKTTLAQTVTQCAELEDQLKKSKQQIASLNVTVKNLGAIIKHNVSQQSSEQGSSLGRTGYSEEAEEAALKEFYREYHRLKKSALEHEEQNEKNRFGRDGTYKRDSCAEGQGTTVLTKTADDTYLYNLDLLQKPNVDNSVDSVLRRTLRKHFALDSSADDGNDSTTPSRTTAALNKLIDISPDSTEAFKATDSTTNSTKEVVTEFGHEPISKSSVDSQQKPNDRARTMNHLAKLEALRLSPAPVPHSDDNYGRLSPISPPDAEGTNSIATEVASTSDQPKTRITIKIGNDLHGETKWKINKDNPVFDDEQHKWESIGMSGSDFRNSSCFFDHPVRYLPEDAASNADAYRTVMIDGIPTGSTMPDVLAIIKGGALESIQLFPPVGAMTTSMTARVVFVYERSAHGMIQQQASKLGKSTEDTRFRIRGVAVRCWMPTDPTYPRNLEIDDEIFGQFRASRLILVYGMDEYVYNQIPYKLSAIRPGCDKHVIAYNYGADDWVSIEFSDVKTAIAAFKGLRVDSELWDAHVQYEEDYTCAPYG